MRNLAVFMIGLSVAAGIVVWSRAVAGKRSPRPDAELKLPRWAQLYSILVGVYMIYRGVTSTRSPVDGLLIASLVVGGVYYLLRNRTTQQ